MLEDITGEELKRQFKTNKVLRYVTIGVGVLVIAILGYLLYRQFVWKPANEKSKNSYWEGLNYAAKDSTAMAIDYLESEVKKYDGKVGGEVAQFVLARQLMTNKDFKGAIKHLEGVDVEDTYVSIMAVGLHADCLSDMKKYEDAANKYLEAADMIENELTTPMYLMKAGLCAEEIKNFPKAAEVYQRIVDDYPAYSGQNKIEALLARASNKKAGGK
ncbi:MAG: tetratricopeptide repeat protein [Crocinitomicaceae bacterium]|nr:tetratricopeptide repeat protein [Crocinitomicaceae bacterium]